MRAATTVIAVSYSCVVTPSTTIAMMAVKYITFWIHIEYL